ncbi:hypothetical protein TA3x_003854 [Tundrisphaera sp. TA3]|uniref:hypothetical protein n=1 Tax=Tundrisphaera sp. TA3 TaxID=3435775 RepID=UPI003EC07E72
MSEANTPRFGALGATIALAVLALALAISLAYRWLHHHNAFVAIGPISIRF